MCVVASDKVAEGQRAVQAANRELAQAKREHEEYKKRAAGILQVSLSLSLSLSRLSILTVQ